MSVDERENYNQEDQDFRDREQYLDTDIDAPPADHSISNNAEPDYGNDLDTREFGSEEFDNENLGRETDTDEFDNDELDDDELDDEFDNENIDSDEYDNEGLGNLDDEDGTNPNRNL
ncbi:hypothetical protein [Flavobacterium defluvii]|uniref:Uncharacterized protein n=1 Tax=Flavobacterium defluvii TaxID=370979 RepID=A0A1M5IW30_9FLAO|nr:hypothetical protein [Flavobacterium defluvii]SHG32514.1 hypothetical protein SAMN05443663_102528 [Flavobacterium defluvii]